MTFYFLNVCAGQDTYRYPSRNDTLQLRVAGPGSLRRTSDIDRGWLVHRSRLLTFRQVLITTICHIILKGLNTRAVVIVDRHIAAERLIHAQ